MVDILVAPIYSAVQVYSLMSQSLGVDPNTPVAEVRCESVWLLGSIVGAGGSTRG